VSLSENKKKMPVGVGSLVQARFGGNAKYFGGIITKDNGDGTFALKYDDGDVEEKVPWYLISMPAVAGDFHIGQKVEARFGGKDKYFGGVISKDNGDGTYAVKYDDGDVEVSVKYIRAVDGEQGGEQEHNNKEQEQEKDLGWTTICCIKCFTVAWMVMMLIGASNLGESDIKRVHYDKKAST